MAVALLVSGCAAPAVFATAPQGAVDGPDNVYTEYLTRVLARWRSPRGEVPSTLLECLATPGSASIIGLHHRLTIQAPLAAVGRVLDDVAHYRDLFPDTVDVHLLAEPHDSEFFVASWTQRPPVFFLPDVTYQLANRVDRSHPGRIVYRYKLRKGDRLLASDGVLVLDAVGPDVTRLEEFDFFRADWGPVPTDVVWRESLRGAYGTDLAIQLKAEHPDWTYPAIEAQRKRLVEQANPRIAGCVAARQPLRLDE
ncbi:MAG: hypothetical protein ABI281_13275 [Caldimonas sp.]